MHLLLYNAKQSVAAWYGCDPIPLICDGGEKHYVKNDFQQRDEFFVEAAGDGAAPTVACLRAQTPAAPTNGTAGASGDTSRPYKWI